MPPSPQLTSVLGPVSVVVDFSASDEAPMSSLVSNPVFVASRRGGVESCQKTGQTAGGGEGAGCGERDVSICGKTYVS